MKLDLTLRDEDGGIIDPEEQNTIELYNNHKTTVERNAAKQTEVVEPARIPQRHTLNLFASISNVVCRVGDDADVIMSLYDSRQQTFFRYVLRFHTETSLVRHCIQHYICFFCF